MPEVEKVEQMLHQEIQIRKLSLQEYFGLKECCGVKAKNRLKLYSSKTERTFPHFLLCNYKS